METLGSFIKKHRKEKGLTLVQLGEAVSLTHGYLSNVENGNKIPSHEALLRLSEVLECSYEELLILAGYFHEDQLNKIADRLIRGDRRERFLKNDNLAEILMQKEKLRFDNQLLMHKDRLEIIKFIEDSILLDEVTKPEIPRSVEFDSDGSD